MPVEPPARIPTDEALAGRAQSGCRDSFDELVRRYQVPLLHFLAQRAATPDAEDLLQETFLRAYKNLFQFKPKWRWSTWLFTIGRRLSINQYRRRHHPTTVFKALEGLEDAAPSPEQLVVADESRHRLWDIAAAVLSEQQNTALWLYYVEEMPVKQIASVLGRSRMAVKTMLYRARKKLAIPLGEMAPARRASTNATPHRLRCATATETNHG